VRCALAVDATALLVRGAVRAWGLLAALQVRPPDAPDEEKPNGDASSYTHTYAYANPPYRGADSGTDGEPDTE